MLFSGPAHISPDPSTHIVNSTAQKAARTVKHAIAQMSQTQGEHERDTATVLADAPSYIFLPSLREILENPDTAIRNGQFQRIKAESIDLPPTRDTPSPKASRLWIQQLPAPFSEIFNKQHDAFFTQPLTVYTDTGRQAKTLPLPKVHASPSQYSQLLKRAEHAGMLRWSLVSEEETENTKLADSIQLTLFAVSKTQHRTRLISWPRVQNDALPDPPYTYLPDPSFFEAVEVNGPKPSAFYLDIENMFHNITLPTWLTKLFPLKAIQARELDNATLQRIKLQRPQLTENGNELLRPCQATMPMGFKWAVFIAHSFVSACLDTAYNLFRPSRMAPAQLEQPHTLHAERAPFIVNPRQPIILHIIDDVTFVATGWSDQEMNAWNKMTRRVLTLKRLPVNENKSSRRGDVEKDNITFIGCLRNFTTMTITPSPDKLSNAIQYCNILLRATAVSKVEWQRIIGRLVWIATLNRPLLACMQRVFATGTAEGHHVIQIKDAWKRELRTVFPLLPMAAVNINMDISQLVIAFDASLEAGAVTKTLVGKAFSRSLWNRAQAARCTHTLPHNHEIPIVKLIANTYPWTKVMSHKWRKKEHINGLEAAAAVLALECAIRAGVRNQRLVMLTDSLVVLGALQKGRSSSPDILVRCRRFAALALAHSIKVTLVYVKSAHNPADKHTRASA